MDAADTTVVVTDALAGTGAALALELARRGAASVAVCDIDGDAAAQVAQQVRALGVVGVSFTVDVTSAAQVGALFDRVVARFGAPHIVCSNVGVGTGQGLFADPDVWTATWAANVMGHVHVAQRALPLLIRRGSGHLMITASAAGLIGLAGDAPYAVTKRAAVGFAEWLAIAYGGRGVEVSALCPLGVRTDLLVPALAAHHPSAVEIESMAPILEPEDVARVAVDAIGDGRFLVLPHPEVEELLRSKSEAPEAWIAARRPVRSAPALGGAR